MTARRIAIARELLSLPALALALVASLALAARAQEAPPPPTPTAAAPATPTPTAAPATPSPASATASASPAAPSPTAAPAALPPELAPPTGTAKLELPDGALARFGAPLSPDRVRVPGGHVALPSREERLARPAHADAVESVAFSADGALVASCSLDFTIRTWSVRARAETHALALPVAPLAVQFAPQGTTLVAVDATHALHVIDGATGAELRTVTAAAAAFPAAAGPPVALSRDLALFAFVGQDRHARTWDIAAGRLAGVTDDSGEYPVGAIAFSADRRLVALGGPGASVPVRLFDATGGLRFLRALATPGSFALAFSPDARFLAAGRADGTLGLFDVPLRQEVKSLAHVNNSGERRVGALAFSADGRMLASAGGDEQSIRLWEIPSGRLVSELTGHAPARTLALAFSPDGRILASGGGDATVILWAVPDALKK